MSWRQKSWRKPLTIEELDEETTELEELETTDELEDFFDELTGVEDEEELVVVDAGTELEDEVDDTTEELEETLGTRYAPHTPVFDPRLPATDFM